MQVALALHDYSKFMQDIIRGQRRRITTPSVSERAAPRRRRLLYENPHYDIWLCAGTRYCLPRRVLYANVTIFSISRCRYRLVFWQSINSLA